MPQPEPPVPTALVVVAVPSTFQENDPPPGSVRLPQVEPSLGSVVARDRPVAQVDPLQAPLLLEPVLLQNLDQLLDRVALDRCRAGGHRDGVPRPLLGGYRQHEGRQAYRDLQIDDVWRIDPFFLFFFFCHVLRNSVFNGSAFARDRIRNEIYGSDVVLISIAIHSCKQFGDNNVSRTGEKILEENSDLYLAMDNGEINREMRMMNRSFVLRMEE